MKSLNEKSYETELNAIKALLPNWMKLFTRSEPITSLK